MTSCILQYSELKNNISLHSICCYPNTSLVAGEQGKVRRSVGCEVALLGMQASVGRDTPYVGLVRLLVRRVQIAKAADVCGELRNRNGGLHGAPLCLVVRMVVHVFTECITQYWWPPGSGTRWYDFTKAMHACSTLGNVREGATLSSETRNGEGNYYFFFVFKSVSTWDNILSADLGYGVLY